MKVLIVTPGMHSPWVDGRITSLKTLAEALSQKGVGIQVLTTNADAAREYTYQEKGVPYLVLPGGSKRNWKKLVQRFSRSCKRSECDVVLYRAFAGFNWVNIVSIFAFRLIALIRNVPFVLSLWSGPAEMLKIPWLFSGVFVASRVGGTKSRILLVPPMVGTKKSKIEARVCSPLKRYGIQNGDRVCLFTYCARVNTPTLWEYTLNQRGLNDVLEAAIELKDFPDLKFLVSMPMLAEKAAREKLEGLLEERGIHKSFVLTNEIEDLDAVLSAVDIYLYPLNLDEYSWAPISVLEAFACSTPVITTCTESVLQFVADDEALLFQPGQSGELARLISRLLSDRSMAHELVHTARRKVEVQNSVEGVADLALEALHKIAFRDDYLRGGVS